MKKIKVEEVEDYLIDLDQVINHNYEQFKAYQTEVNNFSSNSREYFQGKAGDSVRAFLNDTLTPIGGQYEKIRNDVKTAKDRLLNLIKDEFGANGIVNDEYLNQEVTPKVNNYAKELYEYARNINSQISEVDDIVDLDKIRIGTLEADVHSFNTSVRLTIQKLDEVENEINKDLKVINDELMELDSMLTQLVSFSVINPNSYVEGSVKVRYLSTTELNNPKEEPKELTSPLIPGVPGIPGLTETKADGIGLLTSTAQVGYGYINNAFKVSGLRVLGAGFGSLAALPGAIVTYAANKEEGDSDSRALMGAIGSAALGLAVGVALGPALGTGLLAFGIGVAAVGVASAFGNWAGRQLHDLKINEKVSEKFDEAKNAVTTKFNEVGDAITAPFKKVVWW